MYQSINQGKSPAIHCKKLEVKKDEQSENKTFFSCNLTREVSFPHNLRNLLSCQSDQKIPTKIRIPSHGFSSIHVNMVEIQLINQSIADHKLKTKWACSTSIKVCKSINQWQTIRLNRSEHVRPVSKSVNQSINGRP
jgi:hypothetical protein